MDAKNTITSKELKILLEKGKKEFEDKHFKRANQIFSKLLKYKPKNFSIWFMKGNALWEMEKVVEACRCYNKCLDLLPKKPIERRIWYETIILKTIWSGLNKNSKLVLIGNTTVAFLKEEKNSI